MRSSQVDIGPGGGRIIEAEKRAFRKARQEKRVLRAFPSPFLVIRSGSRGKFIRLLPGRVPHRSHRIKPIVPVQRCRPVVVHAPFGGEGRGGVAAVQFGGAEDADGEFLVVALAQGVAAASLGAGVLEPEEAVALAEEWILWWKLVCVCVRVDG